MFLTFSYVCLQYLRALSASIATFFVCCLVASNVVVINIHIENLIKRVTVVHRKRQLDSFEFFFIHSFPHDGRFDWELILWTVSANRFCSSKFVSLLIVLSTTCFLHCFVCNRVGWVNQLMLLYVALWRAMSLLSMFIFRTWLGVQLLSIASNSWIALNSFASIPFPHDGRFDWEFILWMVSVNCCSL